VRPRKTHPCLQLRTLGACTKYVHIIVAGLAACTVEGAPLPCPHIQNMCSLNPIPRARVCSLWQVDDESSQNIPNVYTGALSCPSGFSHFQVGRGIGPETGTGVTIVVCLPALNYTDGQEVCCHDLVCTSMHS
jgi:hypothetical protein